MPKIKKGEIMKVKENNAKIYKKKVIKEKDKITKPQRTTWEPPGWNSNREKN